MKVLCKECNRPLRSAKSIAVERGPLCQKKFEKREKERRDNFKQNVMKLPPEPLVEPVARYIVSNEDVIRTVTGDAYTAYRKAFPKDKLEVLVFADHIQYQAERDEQRHNSADQTDTPKWFWEVATFLLSAPSGVIRVRQTGVAV